jgi:hypothetical protein
MRRRRVGNVVAAPNDATDLYINGVARRANEEARRVARYRMLALNAVDR